MGKRDQFKKNILALTNARTFEQALKGWKIQTPIRISNKRKYQCCELCGTPFGFGSIIRNARSSATITVGGTCLETILLAQFKDDVHVESRRKATHEYLKKAYGDLVDPGPWLDWMELNAPHKMAPLLAQLRHLNMVSSDRDLQRLIQFHDQHRRYAKEVLLPQWKNIEKLLNTHLDRYLTLNKARSALKRMDVECWRELRRQKSQQYFKEVVSQLLNNDRASTRAWGRATKLGRRSILALGRLSDKKAGKDSFVCDSNLADSWPLITSLSQVDQFIWNPKLGLALLENGQYEEEGFAHLWLWGVDRWQKNRFDLRYWREIQPSNENALDELEELAFQVRPQWFGQRAVQKIVKRSSRVVPFKGFSVEIINDVPEPDPGWKNHRINRELLHMARFRRKVSDEKCVKWVQERLLRLGVTLSQWNWMLGQYKRNPDVAYRVDRIRQSIYGRIRV